MNRASGSKLVSADSINTSIIGSWGPMILGHAHPDVVRVIAETAINETSFGAPTAREVTYAKKKCGALSEH